MLACSRRNQRGRRGIVLVLVLGILALMAVIGITFATLSGQARVSARNYEFSVTRPAAPDLMDFALAQLVGDTNDPRSVIRGHSMARDMYGNDGYNDGYLTANLATGGSLVLTAASVYPTTPGDLKSNTIKLATNIRPGTPGRVGRILRL